MKMTLLILLTVALAMAACLPRSGPSPQVELRPSPLPTPSSFNAAINYVQSSVAEERIVGMWAILNYRSRASEAMPFIIQNLHYEPTSDVRSNAARVLGALGPTGGAGVPDLINALKNDNSINVQIDAANALGHIGDKTAVPVLAQKLYEDNMDLAIYSAKSIAAITGEDFPDARSNGGYRIEGGVPLLVSAARQWWETTGQYQDWSK